MTDFITQPDDITAFIAQHLTTQELMIFKMVCQKFNRIGSHYAFLQPLYNRLRALDTSLTTLLDPNNAAFEFKKACEKISLRQKEEIAFLTEKHTNNPLYSTQIAQLDAKNQTIEQLEKQHALLEDMNAAIIHTHIELTKHSTNKTRLNLKNVGITRFFIPNHHADFLTQLQKLILHENCLATINVANFTALTELHCHENASLTLSINMENCTALETAHFLWESVVDLNIKGASPYSQEHFLEMETALLFKQLSETTNAKKQCELIERLGKRYTSLNCYQYSCYSHMGAIAKTEIVSALSSGFNIVSNYLPSFIGYGTSAQETHKRRSEDNKIDDREFKKRKANIP